MAIPEKIRQAAEAAKSARATQGHRDELKKYLSACYELARYTSDELFLRRLLTCCAAIKIYAPRDVAHLNKWLDLVLEKCDVSSL